MKNFKGVLYLIIFSQSILVSCSEKGFNNIEENKYFNKINSTKISDISGHIDMQDSILKNNLDSLNFKAYVKECDTLITAYKSLNVVDKNFNLDYLYLVGTLYLNQSIKVPFDFYFDSLNAKYIYEAKYSSLLDSSYYYLSSAVSSNPENLFAINSLLKLCYFDHQRKLVYKGYNFSKNRYESKFNQIVNIIANKILSKNYIIDENYSQIIELTILELLTNLDDDFTINVNNKEKVFVLYFLGELINKAEKSDYFGQYINLSYYNSTKNKFKNSIAIATKRVFDLEREAKEKQIEEKYYASLTGLNYSHKYVFVKNDITNLSMVYSSLELYGGDSFVWIATEGISGFKQSFHGNYFRAKDKIVLTNASNQMSSKVFTIILKENNIVWLQLDNGETYVQDDDLYYIKNSISTPRERIPMKRNPSQVN